MSGGKGGVFTEDLEAEVSRLRHEVTALHREVDRGRRNETTLHETVQLNNRLRFLFERFIQITPDLFLVYDLDADRCLFASPSVEKVFGHRPDTLMSLGPALLGLIEEVETVPVSAPQIGPFLKAAPTGDLGKTVCKIRHKDGPLIPVLCRTYIVNDSAAMGTGHLAIWTAIDLTRRRQVEAESQARRERLDSLMSMPLVGVVFSRPDRSWIEYSDGFCNMLGYTRQEMANLTWRDICHPSEVDLSEQRVARVIGGALDSYSTEKKYLRKDGSLLIALLSVRAVRDQSGHPTFLVSMLQDITQRRQAEEDLAESEANLNLILCSVEDAFFQVDLFSRIVRFWTNDPGGLYVDPSDFLGRTLEESFRPNLDTGRFFADKVQWVLTHQKATTVEYCFPNLRDDGWFEARMAPMWSPAGEMVGVAVRVTRIAERKRAEQQIAYLAQHDSLTGLLNRRTLRERLQDVISSRGDQGAQIAVLLVDVDRFKDINDTLGHPVGDEVLKVIAERLRTSCVAGDFIGRPGGDEFVLVWTRVVDVDRLLERSRRLLQAIKTPIVIEERSMILSASIGVALSPEHGVDVDTLIRKADLALYAAKGSGRDGVYLFTDSLRLEASERLELEHRLRRALHTDQLQLVYQPKLELCTGQIVGVEVLLRWDDPQLGQVSPSRFIPVAEDAGLIIPLTEWVLRRACQQAVAWESWGVPPISLAVNLSASHFLRRDVGDLVAEILTETRFQPHLLEVELTESVVLLGGPGVLTTLARLKALGVKLTLDDFGTGYSSLAYLKRFKVDKIKIDRSFVQELPNNATDNIVVKSIIMLARDLGIRSIAEGVETEDQLVFLGEVGCDEIQGYIYSEPLSASELMRLLQGLKGAAQGTGEGSV